MKHEVYFGIALRLIVLFSLAMLGTYLPEILPAGFFGDVQCDKKCGGLMDEEYVNWGARHHWYFWMMFSLFVLSLVNLIVYIVNTINKHYPNARL